MDVHSDLRIALLGNNGVGKSASGNTILGRNAFKENPFPHTNHVQYEMETAVEDGRSISVIDTPTLFNASMKRDELRAEMGNCARLSAPGLHAFLLVIRLDVRLTNEERYIVTRIKRCFGQDAEKFTFILFTHADHLNGEHFDEFIGRRSDLRLLIDQCGGRYHSFNNTNRRNRDQVKELLQKIEQVVQIYGRHHRTLEEYERWRRITQVGREREGGIRVTLESAAVVAIGSLATGGLALGAGAALGLPTGKTIVLSVLTTAAVAALMRRGGNQ